MKSKNLKSTLFTFIILLSICSFTYLNTLSPKTNTPTDSLKMEQLELQTESVLPDVKLAEKAIDLVKKMLPANK